MGVEVIVLVTFQVLIAIVELEVVVLGQLDVGAKSVSRFLKPPSP